MWCVLKFLTDNHSTFGIDVPKGLEKAANGDAKSRRRVRPTLDNELAPVLDALREFAAREAPTDAIDQNTTWLGDELELDDAARKVLRLVLRYPTTGCLEDLLDQLTEEQTTVPRAVARVLGMGATKLSQVVSPKGTLVQSGLIQVNTNANYLTSSDGSQGDYAKMPLLIRNSLECPHEDRAALRARVFGTALDATLAWDDFAHVGIDRDLVARVLEGATRENTPGVHVLLYGPPGTGKTQLCRTVAKRLGLALFPVGESNSDGAEPKRGERLAALQLLLRLSTHRKKTVLLFDEMEDLSLSRRGKDAHSKVFINRLLEQNTVPILWTSNHISDMDPAFLRRMTLIVEMRTPSINARERVWQHVLRAGDIAYTDKEVKQLAEDVKLPPGAATGALRAAKLADGGMAEVRHAIRGMCRALDTDCPPAESEQRDAPFDLRLVRTDTDLAKLTERVAGSAGQVAFSLCLYGPPGTGKSLYARVLARALGMPLLKRRASDLLSKWVGQSEKNIASAFEDARDDNALLLFDEADALLADRRNASQSWEFSQVGEMLTQMEAHPLPFCATTNLIDRIDPAAKRRFVFCVRFQYLSRAQVSIAFEHFFSNTAPAHVTSLSNLVPADFARVARKARILQVAGVTELAKLLCAESEQKPGHTVRIGFQPPPPQ